MYTVALTKSFKKRRNKILSAQEAIELQKFIQEIKRSPNRGKILGPHYFREKKINNKRIYFIIKTRPKMILFLDVSTKKYQQKTINRIRENLN